MKGIMDEHMGKVNGNLLAEIRKIDSKELAERTIQALKELRGLYEYYETERGENIHQRNGERKAGNYVGEAYHAGLAEAYKDHSFELIKVFNTLKLPSNEQK